MLRPFYLLCFKISGWKVNGRLPDLNKYIFAVAPHTSNWDFVVGVAARSILRIRRTKFLGKSQLFRKPYGWLFRSIGGIPVYRDKSHDMVEQVTSIARKSDDFLLAIAPEGTRRKVTKLKTGFWYIAKAVNIPIVPVGFDFKKKEVVVGPLLYPTELDKDMDTLIEFYKGIHGKNPELGI
ncbi:MAG TPA: 1-acyl-sn-glycerol-3-phosphate acyltransferase [Cyclobacteriaceae bacterium]|nr:1-acyl-sn-glycerol-3-phosphate acyltransferase [Cyclobacteriaceae bacterium]